VKLFVQEAAEQDILRQIEHYAEQGLSEIARRFSAGIVVSLNLLIERPEIGSPRRTSNPQLSGLRSWPVKGFEDFRLHYLLQPDLVVVVRVLHGKQDTDTGSVAKSDLQRILQQKSLVKSIY
jgi:toxin ParE1/3/4